MLKKGFAALIAAKKVTLSEDVVKELVSRIDTTVSIRDIETRWQAFGAVS